MARAPAGVGDPVSGEQEQEEEQRPGLGPRPRPRVGSAQVPMSTSYIPTEEERRVFRECNQESFYYRYGHKRPMALFEEEQGSSTGVLANIYPSTNITKTDYLVMPFVGPFCANWLPHFPTLQQCNSGYNSLGCKALWDMLNLSKALHKSLPFSGMSMLVTQVLISRGILSTSTRFGSIPKVAYIHIRSPSLLTALCNIKHYLPLPISNLKHIALPPTLMITAKVTALCPTMIPFHSVLRSVSRLLQGLLTPQEHLVQR
ncbi:OCIA domain-containing protein 1 isoform X3 [Heptranchias perlo]|uniref:OCIA domain-containing protein 1 isoform X3 n=1 Tax=Heptranchias perlo TaxID=212740 RepID=UPI00355988F0